MPYERPPRRWEPLAIFLAIFLTACAGYVAVQAADVVAQWERDASNPRSDYP